ncbi:aldo/keto reductase [Ancylomarina sp.]|uniref:aldo/keto reductase n=1 Tax=Ancylomarina sp. TaxID=1970196 RepID=UPI0035689834
MGFLKYSNGDQMPVLGLGTWRSDSDDVRRAVKKAIELGYRHIDCAAIYGNEKEIGEAIREAIAENIVVREELWITSKLWSNAHGSENVIPALKQSLSDLQLDYLDLYLIHFPIGIKSNAVLPVKTEDFAEYPIADTWKGMEAAFEEGLARHIGVCNFSVVKLEKLMQTAQIKPEMNQVEIHAYMQQLALVDFCKANGILLTAYAPLGSSDRPEHLKSKDEPVLLNDEQINAIAKEKGVSTAQVLLAWILKRGISAIPKSVNPARLEQNLAAVELVLSDVDMDEIKTINKDRRYIDGRIWYINKGPVTYRNLWDE